MFFSGSYWYKNATFTVSIPGQYLICAYAMDTSNLQGLNYCYSVSYGIPAPTIIQSSLYPIGDVYIDLTVSFYFSCNFSQIVKRPTSSNATIQLIDASTNTTVAVLNSTNATSVIIANNRLRFTFGNILKPNKTYYINLDLGIFYHSLLDILFIFV